MDRPKFAVGDQCKWCEDGTFAEATGEDADNVMTKLGHDGKQPPAGMILKCDNGQCNKIILSRDPYQAWIAA